MCIMKTFMIVIEEKKKGVEKSIGNAQIREQMYLNT